MSRPYTFLTQNFSGPGTQDFTGQEIFKPKNFLNPKTFLNPKLS